VPPTHVLSIGHPTRTQRVETWAQLLGDRPELAVQMAGGFLLSEGQIELAVAEATARSETKEPSEEALVLAARAQAATGLGTLAHPEETKVDLEQIVLSAETRTLLDELLSYARHREELVAEWGFCDTLSYGLGVTALFVCKKEGSKRGSGGQVPRRVRAEPCLPTRFCASSASRVWSC